MNRPGTEAGVWARFAPLALGLTLLVVYLPSLSGGFLNWDDPWLIAENPVLRRSDAGALFTIWADWSTRARLELGAEFLPIRDTSLWIEARLWGLDPALLRVTNLSIYVAAVLCFRAALLRSLPSPALAEVAAWVFALHPVHVESAAWLAGRKDVLALFFVGAALWVYARRQRSWGVVLLLILAHFSKSMTVVAVGLLLAQDVLARRRPDWAVYGACALAAIASLAIHLHVGSSVAMTGQPVGGSRLSALFTMGPVWLEYVGLLLWPGGLSLVHDVETLTAPTLGSIAGYALLLGWGALGLFLLRRDRRRREEPRGEQQQGDGRRTDAASTAALPLGSLVCGSFLWFVVPLAPVSQVLFPLQNLMADRYLMFSVMGFAVVLAWLCERWKPHGVLVAGFWLLGLAWSTADRAALFGDSTQAFLDASEKTQHSTLAPYQLALAYEEQGKLGEAIVAYQIALERDRDGSDAARRATNNLARLLVRGERLAEARGLLEQGRSKWPDDPKVLANLIKVLHRMGDAAAAKAQFEELKRRFPDYDPDRPPGIERFIGGG